MELPKRKQIRLQGYDYSQSNAYYITICTFNREHLFGEIVGETLCGRPNNPHEMIQKWLLEIENKYTNAKIDNHIIMPDHIHIILFLTDYHAGSVSDDHTGSPLPKIIDWFKTMTTNEYIRGVKDGNYPPFDKHIWQRNYYEHIIRNQQDYSEIWQYINDNPARWKYKNRRGDPMWSPDQ